MGAVVASAYAFLQNQYLQLKQSTQTITALKLDEETRQKVFTALEESIDAQANLNAYALMKDFNISSEQNEYHNHLTHAIQKFAELLLEGTEVHTSLNAPEEIKESFPNPIDTQDLIENTIKLLPENPSEEVNDEVEE